MGGRCKLGTKRSMAQTWVPVILAWCASVFRSEAGRFKGGKFI